MKIRDIIRNKTDLPKVVLESAQNKLLRLAENDSGSGISDPMESSVSRPLSRLPGDLLLSQIEKDFLSTATAIILITDRNGSVEGYVQKEDLEYFNIYCRNGFPEIILDALDVGIIAADKNGRIFFANHAYEELLGIPINKVAGRNIFRIEPESDLCSALRTGKDITNSAKFIKSVERYVSLRIHVYRNPSGLSTDQNIQGGTGLEPSEVGEESPVLGAVSFFTDVTKLESLNTEIERMSGMVDDFRRQLEENYCSTGVITRNRTFLNLMEQATIAAKTDVPVLIRGENGVGKEVIARYIHKMSRRSTMPMIVVNCASIPETLIESELFGYEEGAFTGAKRGGRMGKFEIANHGTIFLDEIGDMPVALQSRLLRVIQNGEIEKIGRQKNIPVDVRIIAATNQPLENMIKEKTFREDLFFRLNVICLKIPPLRDRREDIPLLAKHFLHEFCKKYDREKEISSSGYERLMEQDWNGNVRELQNCIERAVILSPDKIMNFEEFESGERDFLNEANTRRVADERMPVLDPVNPLKKKYSHEDNRNKSVFYEGFSLSDAMAEYEQKLLRDALIQAEGNRPETIRILGISRRTFYRKCAQYGILHE